MSPTLDPTKFEPIRRWAGAPPICVFENLPAFESTEACRDYHEQTNPRGHADDPWPCVHCGGWHYQGHAADPAGGSSGTTRQGRRH